MKTFLLRLPDELHEWLKHNVPRGKSINDFVVDLITEKTGTALTESNKPREIVNGFTLEDIEAMLIKEQTYEVKDIANTLGISYVKAWNLVPILREGGYEIVKDKTWIKIGDKNLTRYDFLQLFPKDKPVNPSMLFKMCPDGKKSDEAILLLLNNGYKIGYIVQLQDGREHEYEERDEVSAALARLKKRGIQIPEDIESRYLSKTR